MFTINQLVLLQRSKNCITRKCIRKLIIDIHFLVSNTAINVEACDLLLVDAIFSLTLKLAKHVKDKIQLVQSNFRKKEKKHLKSTFMSTGHVLVQIEKICGDKLIIKFQ